MDVAKEYAEALVDGASLPPVTVFFDGSDHWLADGFHRVEAHLIMQVNDISADIRQGTRRDAILFAVGANAAHGLPRTNADKRRAVLALINDDEWSTWSDRKIAQQCAVSYTMVGTLRPSLSESDSDPVRVYTDRHGNPSTMRVGGIGKPRRTFGSVGEYTRDFRPRPAEQRQSAGVCGLNGASDIVGIKTERLRKIAKAGEIPGTTFDRGSPHFQVEKLIGWMESAPETASEPPTQIDALPELSAEQDRTLLAVADAVKTLSSIGSPEEVLAAWSIFPGKLLDHAVIHSAAEWLLSFSAAFPAVDAERLLWVEAMLERIDADVVS